jgi:hypothetical protein
MIHRHPPPSDRLSPKYWAIADLPGIGSREQAALVACGIHTTRDLLARTRSPLQCQALATELQLHLKYVTKWAALADLARVPSVGCQYCGALLHAGIGSTYQLSNTPVSRAYQQLLKLHVATTQSKDHCPTVDQVARWVQEARLLSRLNL